MGIRVGKSNPKPFTADTSFNLNQGKQSQTYTADERKALVDSLMRLPKEKVIPALRSAGLDDEANALEQKMAQEHLGEMRKEKLAEIMALPEEERLTALLDNGFTEEAAAESKRQAEAKLWSAVITLLNKYKVIDIANEETHALLESASNPAMNTAERVLFCNDNGLVTLGEAYTSVLDGMTIDELEEQLAEEAKKAEEAAAESKRQAEAKLWSAVITLLNKYKVIDIANEETHALLESASNPAMNTAERVLFCNDNGLVTLGEAYTSVLDGMTIDELEEQLAEEAKKAEEAAAAEANKQNGEGEGTGEGTGDQAPAETPENTDAPGTTETSAETAETPAEGTQAPNEEAPADDAEPEKRKAGRPKKNP